MRKLTLFIGLLQLPGLCADWNPRLAADYLDARQQEWAAWPTAAAPGGTCFSCHTGMTYLLARPELRRVLGETQDTRYEQQLIGGLRTRLDLKDPKMGYGHFTKEPLSSEALGVETIYAALFLQTSEAFDRLWSMQIRDGDSKGSWPWFQLDLDPWETTESPYYGATVAALAVGSMPASYRDRPEVRDHIAALCSYLGRERASQPLHNRLMLLWAATGLPGVLSSSDRKAILAEIREKQQADGGWTLASLGPWKERPTAEASVGSNAYATGLATLVLLKAGAERSDAPLARGLAWLRQNQSSEGYWNAISMNKRFAPGSMQDRFMRDAATGFAALALAEAGSAR